MHEEVVEVHEAEFASTALDLLNYAKEHGLAVEVLMTYSNSLKSGTHPSWTLVQHMSYALGEWDI